jgi:hypothetical protein
MQIVWDPTVIEQLRKSHTVLELESFQVDDKLIPTYCVVPAEKLISEIAQLDKYVELHNGFVTALKEQNYNLCLDISEHLVGKFGGELDSFYEEIISRIKK